MTSCLALTFHGLANPASESCLPIDEAGRHYLVAQEFFAEAVAAVSQQSNCTAADLFLKTSGDWTVITFDDGLISDFEIAYPLLQGKGLAATFFVTATNIGRRGYCSVQQLREMAAGGMEIGSHGLTHSYLVTMDRGQARREIVESKDRLEQAIGRPVSSFAPVGGHFDGPMLQDASVAGYRCFAGMIPGVTRIKRSGFLMRRNHLQACHDVHYLQRLLARDHALLSKNAVRYRILYLAKRILGMQRYDRWKKRFLNQ